MGCESVRRLSCAHRVFAVNPSLHTDRAERLPFDPFGEVPPESRVNRAVWLHDRLQFAEA